MLLRLLKNSDLQGLAPLVSPALVDVVSVPAVLRRTRQALRQSRSEADAQWGHLTRTLADVVLVDRVDGRGLADLPEADRHWVGGRILQVYFRQLFADGPTTLDLRAESWSVAGSELYWSPKAMSVAWDPAFIGAMRSVYRAFYSGDDAGFVAALGQVDLAQAAPLFREHIGSGDPTAVVFDTNNFVHSFGRIFEHCKEAGVRLHPDFVLLGAYLGGLYDSLSVLGVPLDVVDAFARSTAERTAA